MTNTDATAELWAAIYRIESQPITLENSLLWDRIMGEIRHLIRQAQAT